MKFDLEFTRIALVGAPGSGKSSVLNRLSQGLDGVKCDRSDIKVDLLPEAATRLMIYPEIRELRERDGAAFQEKVAITQLFAEDSGLYEAMEGGARRYLQITDRALMDAYVYLSDDQRKSLRFPFPDIDQLCKRYDAVLFFDMYEMKDGMGEGNALRAESCNEELNRLQELSLGVYRRHPVFFRIPTFETVEKKACFVAELINGMLGESVLK
ncbi:MAG: AAA family ATPase [Clostridia bacterium]|nr:AAA family ATPase [Clostridia bacterium]